MSPARVRNKSPVRSKSPIKPKSPKRRVVDEGPRVAVDLNYKHRRLRSDLKKQVDEI